MNKLIDFDNKYTDKQRNHEYLPLYEEILSPIRESATSILEVGIGDFQEKNGGSLLLWRNYFANAEIHGLDKLPITRVLDELITDDKVILYNRVNAYDENFVKKTFNNKKFDFLLDDGPHSLQSQIKFIQLYTPLLKDNGVLIIEDVQKNHFLKDFEKATPDNLKQYIKIYYPKRKDGRAVRDNIVFTIDRICR